MKMSNIIIDPREFINPPYIKCPKCGKESFGVLMISNYHYNRRCNECFYPNPRRGEPQAIFPLPRLVKKIIYVDQFAISNMMKILNPHSKAYQKEAINEFWIRLFERLHSLCKLQLIVCPKSFLHTDESLLSPYFRPLKEMYELLSHSISFHDHEAIKIF